MSAHNCRGARLAATLLLLAFIATPRSAHAQAATRAWSTYLGGAGADRITGIVQSSTNGDAVAVGWTYSRDFPPSTGTGAGTTRDAFVAPFTTAGFLRMPPIIFGGTGEDIINAVALGAQGQIYVVGMTQTASMPGFTNHYNNPIAGDAAFLARFSADGAGEWLMYLDSPGSETATGVTVSGTDIYVTGHTNSCGFLGNTDPCSGNGDGFVVKVANGSATPAILWDTLLTGNLSDFATRPLVVGSTVVVVGSTSSTMFPYGSRVQNFYQLGTSDALAAGLNAGTGDVTWVYYLGGPGEDHGAAVVPAANGEFVVVGTVETDMQAKNVFATRMTTAGQIRSTQRFGGTGDELVSSATVDASGNIYIGGKTLSSDFPLAREFDSSREVAFPSREGFVMVLPAQGGPGWASFVGGNADDNVLALSIRGDQLVMAGETTSSAELILTAGYDSSLSTPPDGFIVAVDTDITPPEPGTVNDRPEADLVSEDIATQTSRDSISANWAGFTDAESDIERYEYAIGTSPGAQDVVPFTGFSFSGLTSYTKTGLTLIEGRTYYTTVRAINRAGLTVTASSNGVRVVPVVTDGGTNGGTDGGTNGGTDGGTDGGTSGGADGGTDGGGSDGEPEEGETPLMGWSCTAAGAGVPMLLGLLALMLLARRRGSQVR